MSRTRSTSTSWPAQATRSTRAHGHQGRGPSRAADPGGGQRLDSRAADRARRPAGGRARGKPLGADFDRVLDRAARGGRPVLRDGDPGDAATGRGDGDAPGAGRAAVGQAVLRVQRAPLAARARRQPVGPERARELGAQRALVSHGRGRRHLDARQVGVPVVRRVGPRVSLRAAVAGRRRLRQGAGRAAAQHPVPAPQRPDSRRTSGTSATSTRR